MLSSSAPRHSSAGQPIESLETCHIFRKGSPVAPSRPPGHPRLETDMWKRVYDVLWRLLRRSQRGSDERRAAAARVRFWAEVREGEREAESHSRR